MKKSLIVLALSMIVSALNASVIELVNTSNFIVKCKMQVVGVGLCGDKWAEVLIAPKQTKVVDAKTCCASRLELAYAPVPKELIGTDWGKTALSEKDLGFAAIGAGAAVGGAALAAGAAGGAVAVVGGAGLASAAGAAAAVGWVTVPIVISVAAGAAAGYGAAQIRLCGARERFEIRINEETKTITVENVTGK